MATRAAKRVAPYKLRILPVTIASLALLLTAKLYDIYQTGNRVSAWFLGRAAIAQDAPQPSKTAQEPGSMPDSAAASPPDAAVKPKSPEPEAGKNGSESGLQAPKREFSEIELNILQSLSERRRELDELEEAIRMKENVLEATEVRLEKKISQIKDLEARVRGLLQKYDQQEQERIKSLVKIYESMRPKEAARIFDQVEMPILLQVVDQMSERRAAPILARMSPEKAKQLTQQLAEDRRSKTQQAQRLDRITN